MTADLTTAGLNRGANYRSRVEFTIQNNCQALADILPRDLSKALGAFGIESETDLRFAQVASGHHGALDPTGHFMALLDHHLFQDFAAVLQLIFSAKDFVSGLRNTLLNQLIALIMHETELKKCGPLDG